MIKFNTASTWGFPVLIKKSAIITPAMVVTGANGKRVVTADTEAMGLGIIDGTGKVVGNTGTGFKYAGLYKGKTGTLLYAGNKGLYKGKKG